MGGGGGEEGGLQLSSFSPRNGTSVCVYKWRGGGGGGGRGGEEAGYETSLTEPVVLTFPISPPICRDSWPLEQYCDDHKTRGDAGVRSHFTP